MPWGEPHSPTTGDMERIDAALTKAGIPMRDENGCSISLADRVTIALNRIRDEAQDG